MLIKFTMKQTKDLKLFLKLTPEEHETIRKKARAVNMSMTQLAKYLLLNTSVSIKID